jgi:hypothetical protein
MKHGGALALLLVGLALAGCRDAKVDHKNNTAVLGGYGHESPASQALTDGRGQAIPAPPAPASMAVRAVRTGDEAAIAAWVEDKHVVASTWTRATGWSAPQPLERIYGESSELQVASNGQGPALAVWHHRVGNIHSLRFSRFDGSGWSVPDVIPGALPQPAAAGSPAGQSAAQLEMDAQGNVVARWPSGFHADEMQVARYSVAEGWTHAASEPVASAQNASPAPRAPSSVP